MSKLRAVDQHLLQGRPLCLLARVTVRKSARIAQEDAAARAVIDRRVNTHGGRDVPVDDRPIPVLL
eukprot:2879545-Heterocapsa_arctica.AAC.1